MASGTRLPTWKERENNRRRERRRRAIAAKIYSGLRMHGNYKLPKHCDNNEVLKALCSEAGWIVEEDGLTYKKYFHGSCVVCDLVPGFCSKNAFHTYCVSTMGTHLPAKMNGMKPPERTPETGFAPSPFMSPASSSYPSPASSACPSPVRSSYGASGGVVTADNPSLIPWLKGLSSSKVISYGGSYSAPVTPPLSSPTCRSPRAGRSNNDWDAHTVKSNDFGKDNAPADCAATALQNAWSNSNLVYHHHHQHAAASCPPSPLLRAISQDHPSSSRSAVITVGNGSGGLVMDNSVVIDKSTPSVSIVYNNNATTTTANNISCSNNNKTVSISNSTMSCSPNSGIPSPTPAAAMQQGAGGMWVSAAAAATATSSNPWGGASSSSFSSPHMAMSMWRPGYVYVSPAASVCNGEPSYHDANHKEEVVSGPTPAPAPHNVTTTVNAWAGEQIHEECPDISPKISAQDLELKL